MWPTVPQKTPDGVAIHLISGSGTPSELERREHCQVSATVRQDLGLSWNSQLGNYGQIRVLRRASAGMPVDFTATFTVVGLNNDSGRTLSIHPNATGGAGGVKKLTGVDGSTTALGVCQIWAVAPGHTSFTDAGGVTEEGDLLTEPLQGTEFSESARAAGHNRLALLVPHGGGIDRWTGDERAATRGRSFLEGGDHSLRGEIIP